MYAKLINGALQYAPNHITVNGNNIWNASAELMLDQGWKPVVFTEQPEPEPGYYYESGWKETTKKITQTWTKKEAPDDVSDSEALATILEVLG